MKKCPAVGGDGPYPGSWTACQREEDRISVHVSADSWEQIRPFSNPRVLWQDCRGQILQPLRSGFKTSSKSLKPTLFSSLENADLSCECVRFQQKFTCTPSWQHGTLCLFPLQLPPLSTYRGKFVFSPGSLQQGTSLLYLETTLILLCAMLEIGGDRKRRKNGHIHWNTTGPSMPLWDSQ